MITEISRRLKPVSNFIPGPPASDRSAWEALPSDLKKLLTADGEQYLHYPFPSILATDFMEFCRTGNRTHYEDKLFKRRTVLNSLVLAECVEYKGRFLDDIINAVFLICEESAWQLPAHNSYIRDTPQFLLPDVTRPVVDLFAAEAGAVLAVTEYLFRDAFAAVSPDISIAVNHNLNARVLRPYLEEHFWWMGDGISPMNNWTAWCTQNVLLTAFTRQSGTMDSDTLNRIFQKACQSLDYFLDEYGEDGCCDEGAQYYRHAGLTLFNSLEILNGITENGFSSVYQQPKIYNIAAYIFHAHIAGPYYVNFSDCAPVAGRCTAREYLFGKRTQNPQLMAFAAEDFRSNDNPLIPEEHNPFYRLQTIFTYQEMLDYACENRLAAYDGTPTVFYPSVGLFMTRDDRYVLAVKAGDNGDSHNHNDTGSFTIYKDGKPLFIDVGVESYTKKTFSPQRYEIWTMQSAYHNLPSFSQVMQKDGECYGARDVKWQSCDENASIHMDLAGAYPDCHPLISYERTARLDRGTGITITDVCAFQECTSAAPSVVLSLMTYEKPEIMESSSPVNTAGIIGFNDGGSCIDECSHTMMIGTLGICRITGAADITVEEIPITDARLAQTWKHSIYRTLVTLKGNQLALHIS